MSLNLGKAFKEKGINVTYKGQAGKMLALTDALLTDQTYAGVARTGKDLVAGDIIISWRDQTGAMKGAVIDPMVENDLYILVRRNDGSDHAVGAQRMDQAIASIAGLIKSDRLDRKSVAEANRKAMAAFERAEAQGQVPEEPTLSEAKFADGAFDHMADLVGCMKARTSAEYRNEFTGPAGATEAANAEYRISKAQADLLDHDELSKAREAHMLRAEIAKLEAGTRTAPAQEMPEDLGQASEAQIEALGLGGPQMSASQVAAMAPNSDLIRKAFAPLTSLPLHSIKTIRLSPRDANKVLQDLRQHENKDWAPGALAKSRDLLTAVMPGYTFTARIFSKDGADLMLINDQAGPALYAWDSATRVMDYDTASEMKIFTPDDVPEEEELQALRARALELRHDVTEDIEFDFNDAEDDAVFEDGALA